jgi:hypothetical protein
MTTTKTTPKCWVNPNPIRREESETPHIDHLRWRVVIRLSSSEVQLTLNCTC